MKGPDAIHRGKTEGQGKQSGGPGEKTGGQGGKTGGSGTAKRQAVHRTADTGTKKAAENESPRPDPFQAKLMELKKKFKDR